MYKKLTGFQLALMLVVVAVVLMCNLGIITIIGFFAYLQHLRMFDSYMAGTLGMAETMFFGFLIYVCGLVVVIKLLRNSWKLVSNFVFLCNNRHNEFHHILDDL